MKMPELEVGRNEFASEVADSIGDKDTSINKDNWGNRASSEALDGMSKSYETDCSTRKPASAVGLHKCKLCQKVFQFNAHLKEHEASHSNRQPFSCSECSKRFKRKNAMLKHMRSSHPKESDWITCACGKAFPDQKSMDNHQECSGNVFVCPECGVFYKTRASLESHMLLHSRSLGKTGEEAWPYTCHLCEEKLCSKVSLTNHVNQTHSTQSYKCDLCSKTFKTKQFLVEHSLRKHKAGNQEFKCSICTKVFSIPKDLRRHMLTHNPEDTHYCSVCHKKFKVYSTLQSHMKMHSKDKPYDCIICLIPNATLEDLKSHIVTEHGIEVDDSFSEYWNRKCPVCGQVFLRRTSLTMHIKTHNIIKSDGIVLQSSSNESRRTAKEKRKVKIKTSATVTENKIRDFQQNKSGDIDMDLIMKNEKAEVTVDDFLEKTDVDGTSGDSFGEINPVPIPDDHKEIEVVSSIVAENIKRDLDIRETQAKSIKTSERLDQQAFPVPAGEKPSSSNEEETKYICGQCSSVFIDVEDLKTHLLTCYQQETNDDYVVVFEVDEDN